MEQDIDGLPAYAPACKEDQPSRRAAMLHTRNLALGAAAMAALPSVSIGTAEALGLPHDPLPALVARFLPIHAEYWAIGADLNARYAQELRLGHDIVPTLEVNGAQRQFFHSTDEIREFFDTRIADIVSRAAEFLSASAIKAQRAHLIEIRDCYVAKFEQHRADWQARHDEIGLSKLEAAHTDAERRLDEVEAQITDVAPQSLAGVAAMLRYALAYATDRDAAPEDQPLQAKAIAAALAFLQQGSATP